MNYSLNFGRKSIWQVFLGAVVLYACSFSVYALELAGELHWAQRVELSLPVKGVIEAVQVRAGQVVSKGERLLVLDQRAFKSRLKGQQAEIKGLQAVRDEMQRELERSLELYDRTVLSEHELQVAKNNRISAEADYQKGLASLKKARLDLEYSELRAPFDGIIISRYAQVGQVVVPDLQPVTLMVLAADNVMQAWCWATTRQLAGITLGQKALIKLAGQQYPGQLTEIALEPDSNRSNKEKYYRLIVEFSPDGKLSLRAGTPVTVVLP